MRGIPSRLEILWGENALFRNIHAFEGNITQPDFPSDLGYNYTIFLKPLGMHNI